MICLVLKFKVIININFFFNLVRWVISCEHLFVLSEQFKVSGAWCYFERRFTAGAAVITMHKPDYCQNKRQIQECEGIMKVLFR